MNWALIVVARSFAFEERERIMKKKMRDEWPSTSEGEWYSLQKVAPAGPVKESAGNIKKACRDFQANCTWW